MSLIHRNCNLDKVTSKVKICSVHIPPLPSLNSSFRLLCYYAVPFWPTTEQFRVYSFHSFSSTSISSATNEYGTVPERSSRNEERTKNTFCSGSIILQLKRSQFGCTFELEIMNPNKLTLSYRTIFLNFPITEKLSIFLFSVKFKVSPRE